MNSLTLKTDPQGRVRGFTLVEMLVVIAIMSILMTAGAIGLSGMGGKGVTSGVASAESLFDEARSIAVGKNLRAAVLVAKDLTNNKTDNLKRIIVAAEETETNASSPNFGQAANPTSATPNWVVSSRGTILPDQVYFSQVLSEANRKPGSGSLETVGKAKIKSAPGKSASASYDGDYYIYEFNAEGICKTPGASFIIGTGARPVNKPTEKPKVTASSKRDFGGFMVWRNGRTSMFRSPAQMDIPGSVDTSGF